MFNFNRFPLFKFPLFGDDQPQSDDDFFSHTRMSFGDHLEDLRWHLIRAILGFLVALGVSFIIGYWVLEWIQAPVQAQLEEYAIKHALANIDRSQRQMERYLERLKESPDYETKYKKLFEPRELVLKIKAKDAKELGWKVPEGAEMVDLVATAPPVVQDLKDFPFLVPPHASLISLEVQEPLVVWLQVCLVTALVIGSPWIFFQIWSFIAAGLYPHEKKMVNLYLPISLALFLSGVLFSYFYIIPQAVGYLLEFNAWLQVEPQIRLSEWLGFAIWVPLLFGLAFQTPLVMFFLERLGLMSIKSYRSFRRYAWFVMALVAIFINPTIDPIMMLILWVPLCAFYEAGIVVCWLFPRKEWLDMESPESEELIEV